MAFAGCLFCKFFPSQHTLKLKQKFPKERRARGDTERKKMTSATTALVTSPRRRKKSGGGFTKRREEIDASEKNNDSENSSSKARKRKDTRAIKKLLKFIFVLVGVFLGLSLAAVATKRRNLLPTRSVSSTRERTAPPAMDPKQMRELERAREVLKKNYEESYEAIESEFSIFSDQSKLDAYSDAFSESMTERGRAVIWERAAERFYSRAEYDVDGERGRQLREVHGTFAPELSAKKQFAEDDPKRFKRLMELVRDKKENGPENTETQKGKKDVEVEMRKDTKKLARSAALTAFVFEVLETLREEGSSFFAEAPEFDV